MQPIVEPEKIEHMIKSYVVGQIFFLKNTFPTFPVKIIDYKPDEGITVESDYPLEEQCILYKVFNKYMEAPCAVERQIRENHYLLSVKAFNIALQPRATKRVTIADQAYINNIRAARNTINASLFNIPTSVKVHFSQYEAKLKHLADDVSIKVFDKLDDRLDLVKKSHKVFWLEDTQDILSYMPEDTEGFIDYRDVVNTEMDNVMNDYRKAKIVSEVIVPVIYVGHDGKPIPLGYIHLISKSKKIGLDTVMELKVLSFEMVDRIRESNTMLINKKQAIANISKGGLQLKIDDPELKQFLVHQKGLSFDVIFKLQTPITVFTDIIYVGSLPTDDLVIGVKIMGRSSRKGEMERYEDMVEQLEAKALP